MQTKSNKLKGFTLVELVVVIAIIALLAAIGIPAILAAQRSARNATRFKQLEAVRNAMSDYFTKYNEEPSVYKDSDCKGTPSSSTSVYVANDDSCSRRIQVIFTDSYNATLSADCATESNGKAITYYISTGSIFMCKEGGGTEEISFKQNTNEISKEIN